MDIEIDRLALRVPGLSEAEGRQLAELVGRYLAASSPPARQVDAASLSVSLPARSGEPLESLAQRIVAEMLRSLSRSVS